MRQSEVDAIAKAVARNQRNNNRRSGKRSQNRANNNAKNSSCRKIVKSANGVENTYFSGHKYTQKSGYLKLFASAPKGGNKKLKNGYLSCKVTITNVTHCSISTFPAILNPQNNCIWISDVNLFMNPNKGTITFITKKK